MDAAENVLHGIVERLSTWLPGGGGGGFDALTMSREFWMPDRSCRVCYECESQFTIFNRRHHCRICGRVFCGKCTLNTIPASSSGLLPDAHEDGERIRVCNFCYKLRQQLENDNSESLTTPSLTPTSSRSSLFSSNTSGTSMASPPQQSLSAGNFAKQFAGDGADLYPDYKNKLLVHNLREDAVDGKWIPSSFHNRSDDDYEDRKEHQNHLLRNEQDADDGVELDADARHRSQSSIQSLQSSENLHSDDASHNRGDASDSKSLGYQSSGERSSFRRSCEDIDGLDDEGNFHGQLYEAAYREVEQPVDFENNNAVWIPPPPEEDEDELGPGYDDDDDDDEGGWGLPRSSGSMSSSEYRSRERAASEEHRKAMRAVVDGHFRALVAQLLKTENFPVEDEDDKESWLEIVTSLALQAASIVKPDSSRGGSMDPGGYVKVKCIASGRRTDSMIIKGIVCKKNLAHRRMPTRFKNPRLLLLGGALEYQRVSNHLSSMDTLLQQERDYLNMAAARIEAHHPNVLLVEKGVSRFAQDRLLAKEISLVQNVKRPLLERIARCTGAQIVSLPDNLMAPKTGHCELFHVEKFSEQHGTAGQGGKPLTKTLMFFEGCPKPLGCTALLRGANGDDLKKIKRVLQLSVFAAYHLALETSFLADEGATLPDHRSPIVVTLPSTQSSSERSITSIPGFAIAGGQAHAADVPPRGIPVSPHQSSATSSNRTDLEIRNSLSGPSGNTSQTLGSNSNDLKSNGFTGEWQMSLTGLTGHGVSGLSESFRKAFGEEASRSYSSNMRGGISGTIAALHEMKSKTAQHFPVDNSFEENPLEVNSLCVLLIDKDSMDADEEQSGRDDFPPTPSDHQSILVSLSTRCLRNGTVCERPYIVRIKYYGNSDKPLGRFLRDTLFDLNNRCQHCDELPDVHIRCYTHRLGSLTISVRRLESEHVLPGERDGKIWMWHRCLKCARINGIPPVTRRIVMSDAAWGLSFGKFLELSFSNHAAKSRVAACGHSLHRDCLRFYGFGSMIACFRYASVHLHSVHLPPPKLEFNDPNQQDWLRKEVEEVANKGELVFAEILDTLRVIGEHIASSGSFSGSGRIAEVRKRAGQLEVLFQKEKAEFEEALLKAAPLQTELGQPVADVLELHRLRKHLVNRALEWDKRLHYFASSQQRKFSTGSDSGLMLQQASSSKDPTNKANLLKTYSNSDVGGIVQPFSPGILENGSGIERSAITGVAGKGDSSMESDAVCGVNLIPDGVACLPSVSTELENPTTQQHPSMEATEPVNLDSIEGDIRRSLSEGNCPVLADLSHTLDAAWIGEAHVTEVQCAPANTADEESRRKGCELESNGENESETEGTSTCKQVQEGDQVPVLSLQQRLSEDSDEIGNWIGGPFSTLYRGRGSSTSQSEMRVPLGSSSIVSRAGQVALEGGARLFFPAGVNGIVTAVYEDEPTSIIAHALLSQHYVTEISGEKDKQKDRDREKENGDLLVSEESVSHPLANDGPVELSNASSRSNSFKENTSSGKPSADDPVKFKIENTEAGPEAKLKYMVTAYYAKHFDALRKKCCGGDFEFVRSLSRCRKWGAQGGKSNVFFAKSMDDRFIIKQVTRTELFSFLEFAPEYFKYLSDSLNSGSPTCLAKILGMYQVAIKQLKGGKEVRMDLMVMENLLYGRHITRLYDLKGSVRSRYNSDSTGKNTVLLDQNLLESMPTAPIFVGNKAKRLLERAVWNDTQFLASIDVMDYSLLVGIDEERGELVLGIIDFMRQYTWDKHLETWVKLSGILGGPKNAAPTVISPKQYKKRFRKAMSTYFVTVPDQWTPPSVISAHPAGDKTDEAMHEECGESFTS